MHFSVLQRLLAFTITREKGANMGVLAVIYPAQAPSQAIEVELALLLRIELDPKLLDASISRILALGNQHLPFPSFFYSLRVMPWMRG